MSRCRRNKWTLRQHFNYLSKHFPLDRPVKMRVCFIEDAGDIGLDGQGFTIRISIQDCLSQQKETLWHEWSHARVGWSDRHQHTNAWGVEYARIYRAIQEEV